jgi:tetratricopeptide (TPR) repeat protein
VGSGAYLLIEIAPDFRGFSWHNVQWKLKTPGQRIALLKEAIEESDTFANRTALAEEYYRQKQYDKAAQSLKASLAGPYQDDAYALMDLAECYFASGKYSAAKEVLGRVDVTQARELENRKILLEARTLEALGSKRPAGELSRRGTALPLCRSTERIGQERPGPSPARGVAQEIPSSRPALAEGPKSVASTGQSQTQNAAGQITAIQAKDRPAAIDRF